MSVALGNSGSGINVNASIGGGDGTGPALFGPNGLNLGLGVGAASTGWRREFRRRYGVGSGSLTPTVVLQRFREMSVNDQRKMLVRCRDISVSSGYDSGLAGLCGLLRSAASR
jgi:hypothetical protein